MVKQNVMYGQCVVKQNIMYGQCVVKQNAKVSSDRSLFRSVT